MSAEVILSGLDGIPVVRWVWRKLLERGLDVKFHDPSYHLPTYGARMSKGLEKDEPIFGVQVHPDNSYIHA